MLSPEPVVDGGDECVFLDDTTGVPQIDRSQVVGTYTWLRYRIRQVAALKAKFHVEGAKHTGQSQMVAEFSPDDDTDPRLHTDHVRQIDGQEGTITLLGVVHDHPASRYRVREFVREAAPDVLGLEVGPLALPLFEQYAADGREIPAFGGEVSAAIAAAGDAEIVGIDRVDWAFCRRLAGRLVRERASLDTVATLGRGMASVLGDAARCRIAATVASLTGVRLEVDEPVGHDCSLADPPAVQAADEHSQLSKSLTLLRAANPPAPVRVRDATRDDCMARRLAALRERGDVVAVVGRGHLDPLAERLTV